MTLDQAKATWAEIVARRKAGDLQTPVYGVGSEGAAAALKDFDPDETGIAPPLSPTPPSSPPTSSNPDSSSVSGETGGERGETSSAVSPPTSSPQEGMGSDWFTYYKKLRLENPSWDRETLISEAHKMAADDDEYENADDAQLELASQRLDEAGIPKKDPFRAWFLARHDDYYLPSQNDWNFQMAEDDFEKEKYEAELRAANPGMTTAQIRAKMDAETKTGTAALTQLQEIAALKKQLEDAQKQQVIQATAAAQLATIQSLPAGEQREKSLQDFVQNVLPNLLKAGVGMVGLATGNPMMALGGFNSLSQGMTGTPILDQQSMMMMNMLMQQTMMQNQMMMQSGGRMGGKKTYRGKGYNRPFYYTNGYGA